MWENVRYIYMLERESKCDIDRYARECERDRYAKVWENVRDILYIYVYARVWENVRYTVYTYIYMLERQSKCDIDRYARECERDIFAKVWENVRDILYIYSIC